ncbi:hypothetical protein N0V86_007565 [Didymella sp. IMI 355093]|nr:hypothetical protein N0V86_007565 [Didymella sp. IMI 355093]
MRLLQRDDQGKYSLTEFVGEAIPRYAILSHTWGADDDEVTLADLEKDIRTSKAGYRKLQFCADQAAKHGIRYFWVDTCCIDKTSSAELTEAINSMFAWYRDASRCYVYLSDVSTGSLTSNPPTQQDWYPAFQQSRWFTRGWTLQELVAPMSVEFFSVEGQRLEDKHSLLQELNRITGISVEALQGRPLNGFSVDERMSWVEQRKTKREEDLAYSLLGIFGVHMPLIYGEGRKNAFARLLKEINFNFGPSTTDGQQRKVAPFSTVPFAADPDFVDRPAILAWVHDKCAGAGARAALVGLGGVGKSQLALQYAHSILNAAPQTLVFWVHASTRARFEEAYRDMAERLQLPGRSDPKANVLRLVSEWLQDETNGRWVMVLDNADNVETFFPSQRRQRGEADANASAQTPLASYLPQSRNGAILVTSRSKDAAERLAGGYNKIKEVLAMDETDGLQLLRNKLRHPPPEEKAVELLRALDCIPLAISQAAAYINRRARMTVAGYLSEFRRNSKKRESLLNWDAGELRRDESASNSVVTTWQMSFEQIRQERRSAAELLSLMSFFNPQGIPESTLRRYSRDTTRKVSADNKEDEDEADSAFDNDLDMLQAYSLISVTADADACEMHALVQFCTQVWLSSFSNAEQWQQRFVALMAQELPNGEYENWAKCQQLLPHVEPLFESKPAAEEVVETWAQVLTTSAEYLRLQGRYNSAQQLEGNVLAAREKVFGLHDRRTLASVSNLAQVLRAQGKYAEAETLNRRALEGREKKLGEQHPDTLISVSNLAVVLQYQGKYAEAETLNRRALERREKELGEQHPDTLISVNNLATVLRAQGKYAEAETLNRRALERREKELGEQHPDTLTSVSNLAVVLQYQGKYAEAETLNRRALEGREKELGEQHPDTLTSVSNLAVVLQYQGKYAEAETLNRRVLEGCEKALGQQHSHTLTFVSNLATVLQYQGKYAEAETLNQRALEGRERELGEQHPDTLTSVNNLATVLQCQGKYAEAETLNRRALEGRERELGEQHPDTLTSVYCLAHLLHTLRRYAESAELYQRACDGHAEQLGPDHPHTIACRKHFAAMQQEAKLATFVERESSSETPESVCDAELGKKDSDAATNEVDINDGAAIRRRPDRDSGANTVGTDTDP